MTSGPHAGKVFDLSKTLVSIGRGPENDVILINDPQVSRQHLVIELIDQDFIVKNLSEKNFLYADGQVVSKWKLANSSKFKIGESEFVFNYDLGQSVRQVANPASPSATASIPAPISEKKEISAPPKSRAQSPAKKITRPGLPASPGIGPVGQPRPNTRPPPNPILNANYTAKPSSVMASSNKGPFYILVGIVVLALAFLLYNPKTNKKNDKRKPAMKYEDEIAYNLNSQPEKKMEEQRQLSYETKNSPQSLRAQENLKRGMRDFRLGQYSRAMDNFQVVLNLEPTNALAKRYLYQSKVRFDELLQEKLMLGESNYQKHNFSMCESYYQQVIDMLQGQSSDQNYLLALSMVKKCQLAQEGIR